MTTNLEALRLVDEMRSRGIRSFKVGDVEAEFFPAEPAMAAQKKAVDEDECRCGHSLANEHMNGCCVAPGGGCDPRVCAPPEK